VSLVAGRGPLSSDPAGRFAPPIPGGVVYIEPHPRRVQAKLDGHVVIDTEQVLMVHRQGHPLSYLFRADEVGELPSQPEPEAPGFVYVPWDAVDNWLEEGRELVHYPPNPYHRVDCRPTRRRLRVSVAGTTLVDTDDTMIVFETALAPRLYVDPSLVRTDLLHRSPTSSYCNYKGFATYWSMGEIDDIAWSYPEPPPESLPIKGFLSFDATRADVIAELPNP
ncbi:acyl-CoA thioesterase, partial [Mycobacterium numidiamassiliense]